jgi:hypothetical protein
VAEVAGRTVAALQDIAREVPQARTVREAVDAVMREDRRAYVGIFVIALAVLGALLDG